MSDEGFLSQLKRLLVGTPIPSHLAHQERLSRVTGLAVLSSDALSSVAYATEAVLLVLVAGGVAALRLAIPISVLIATLLAIIAFSYRQTVFAYPSGGGAYIVAKENLGQTPALGAASALLIDYTLTVAVSIAAGVAAVTSAFPNLHINRVEMGLGFILVIALGNLRGIRESGRIFSVPTYFFIGGILTLIALGFWRYLAGAVVAVPAAEPIPDNTMQNVTVLVLLTAFSDGCTAMTGVEAVSNGVPAFRPPESKNAAATLVTMAVLAITMFMGITLLANAYHIVPNPRETVVSQIARGVFGGRNIPYFFVQAATTLILVLAANTAYADFPRLASIVARDRFMPRQFMNQGDRLAFSNGILSLSFFAAVLIVIFDGSTQALLPLYMVGVFVSFTLSQSGMVVRWRRLRTPGWRMSAAINAVGAATTSIVLIIVTVTKSLQGAWIIIVLVPTIVMLFKATRRHYDHVAEQLTLRGWTPEPRRSNIVIVPVSGIHRAVVGALQYARTLSADVRAVYVDSDPMRTDELRRDWETWGRNVPLVILASPYRSLIEPLVEYIEHVDAERPDDFVTVILPEFVPARWWQHLLHNQRALLIKGALFFKPHIIVTSVPFHLER